MLHTSRTRQRTFISVNLAWAFVRARARVGRPQDQKYCLLVDECRKYAHRAAARDHYQRKVAQEQEPQAHKK